MPFKTYFLSSFIGFLLCACATSGAPKEEKPVVAKTMTSRVERSELWETLTNKKNLSEWWNKGVRLEPDMGGAFYEPWGKDQLATGKVVDIDIDTMIKFTWREKTWNSSIYTVCEFQLVEGVEETTLKVVHSGWEKFPKESQKQLIEGFGKGWDSLLAKLKVYLERSS